MKKISNPNKMDLSFSIGGRSIEKGIVLNITKEYSFFRGRASQKLVCKKLAVDEGGKIQVYGIGEMEEFIEEENESSGKRGKVILYVWMSLIIASIALMVLSLFVFDDTNITRISMSCLFIFLGTIKCSGHIVEKIMAQFGDRTIIKKLRYHAAEHMAVNAFYDLKRVPTLRELKNYSMFAYNCSVRYDINCGITFLVLGICRLIPDSMYFFFAYLITMGVYVILSKVYNLDIFLEIISLKKPTNRDCRLALACLDCVIGSTEDMINYFDTCKKNPFVFVKLCKKMQGFKYIYIDRIRK